MVTTNPSVDVSRPSYKAYKILHVAFILAPLLAGVDKFFDFLVNWPIYLSPLVSNWLNRDMVRLL